MKTFVHCHSLQLGGVIIFKQCLHGQVQADNTNVETIMRSVLIAYNTK